MESRPIVLAVWLVAAIMAGTGIAGAQERPKELTELAARLNISNRGVSAWLDELGARSDEPGSERLLIVSASGEPIATRKGTTSSVVIEADLDRLLREHGQRIVLVHNHPSSVGLSAADIGNVAKPGIAAIVAIGHDGSVFIASAGPAMDPDLLEATQYARALQEVKRRLRLEWPSRGASVAASDAQLNHLVARALAKADIIRYWSELRGSNLYSYQVGQPAFSRVVAGAAAYLRRLERSAPPTRR
jgi:hypothetical protein